MRVSLPSGQPIRTTCCIAGGGPAGMMLGFLLARSGVDVFVLEKHADFLRDFRGDTVHPSTLELIYEFGLLDDFLSRPHQKVQQITVNYSGQSFVLADFSHLKVKCPYIALMPQWDFLDFLADHGKTFPNFHLEMQAEATDLLMKDGHVIGVKVKTPKGIVEVHSDLVVAADGRHSQLREKAGLKVQDFGVPIDVFWLRLSRRPTDISDSGGNFSPGNIIVMLNRQTYWQCAFVIPKGAANKMKQQDVAVFRQKIAATAPFLSDRVHEIKSWDDVKLLTVKVDRLAEWARPGLLCIGDAAHAMSPIGGVGINLAVQDAVAAANTLIIPLKENRVSLDDLRAVQKRRELPTCLTQRIQLAAQNQIISNVLTHTKASAVPLPFWLIQHWRYLRRLTGYAIGIGIRPEHIVPLP